MNLAATRAAEPFQEPAEDDVLVWLSEQWWTPWVMLAAFTIVGIWMVRSLLLHRGRAHQIEMAAKANGMSYRAEDGFGLSRISFHHMSSGGGRGWTASHVVTHTTSGGAKVHAFDVRSWTEYEVIEKANGERTMRRARGERRSSTSNITRKHNGATKTAAVAPLPINAPQLVIGRENLLSKAFATATRLDIDVESEAFNRSYHVIGADRAFARAVLDAQVVDLIVSTEGKITFEFLGTKLLLHTEQLPPDLMPGLARLAEQVSRVVPRLVIDQWGSPSAASTR